MLEAQAIALAGLLQACRAVRELATRGQTSAEAMRASLASVFRIDADDTLAVYGGLVGLRLGFETLLIQLEEDRRDLMLTRLALAVLRLERRLRGRRAMLHKLGEGIQAMQRQVDHFSVDHPVVLAGLAELYVETLSTLRPNILVHGDPQQLANPQRVEQIRAMLLAAVRAAVLWHQLGGGQIQLLLQRRRYAMLARGLLTRSLLDHG